MDEQWVTLIAAGLGSTGLIGVITALITRTRVSRLRRFVDESKSVKETLADNSKAGLVLDQAIDAAALRLAAAELTRFGSGTRLAVAVWILILAPILIILGALGVVSAFVAIGGLTDGDSQAFTSGITTLYLAIIYVFLGVSVAVFLVQWRREKIMTPALLSLPVIVLTPEIRRIRRAHVEQLRRKRAKRARQDASKRYQKRFSRKLDALREESRARRSAPAVSTPPAATDQQV